MKKQELIEKIESITSEYLGFPTKEPHLWSLKKELLEKKLRNYETMIVKVRRARELQAGKQNKEVLFACLQDPQPAWFVESYTLFQEASEVWLKGGF